MTLPISLLFLFFLFVTLIGSAILLNRKRSHAKRTLDMIFLKVLVPRKESEKENQRGETTSGMYQEGFKEFIGVMEQLFANLYSIYTYKNRFYAFLNGTDYLSFEYVVIEKEVNFYVVFPRKLLKMIEKQITSFYPEAVVEQVEDYNIFRPNGKQTSTYFALKKNYGYPIKTFKFMETDPLNSMVNSLSKLGKDESAAIQIMVRPARDGWQKKCKKIAMKIKNDKKVAGTSWNPLVWIGNILDALVGGDSHDPKQQGDYYQNPLIEEQMKILSEKSSKLGYHTIIRAVASAPTKEEAIESLVNVESAFNQFSGPNINEFIRIKNHNNRFCITNFIYRYFKKGILLRLKPKMIFSCAELGTLFHFPHTKYNKMTSIQWQNYKIAPAPANIPAEGILLGYNLYRGIKTPIYMKKSDRFRHFYVIGQTGTGKSTMLINLIMQDLKNNEGFCVMDPHGQLAEDIFPHIPRERADDIIYFNPSDTERPMGMNMLEADTDEEKELVAMDAMNIMLKLFGNEIFGPRIQDYFRNGCLTLMSDPEGGALTDIVRLFTDDVFQQYKVSKIKNPIVKAFWEKQMAQTGQREKQEMIPYFAAKFGQFTTNALMRNIIGQTKSSFDVSEIMNKGKILLVNLSKGLIGDINSDLLGLMFVSKIQVAAMRRQRQSKEERRDFFLYIDEFQNYITDSIESILSEARKYRLSLNVAHQYLGQLEKNEKSGKGKLDLKAAIFGNVGTIMSYKIGATDAEYMEKEMSPVFSQQDLINIDKFKGVVKLSIDTQPSRPFSLIPLNPYLDKGDLAVVEAYKQLSRLKYGRDREFVDREIMHRIGVM